MTAAVVGEHDGDVIGLSAGRDEPGAQAGRKALEPVRATSSGFPVGLGAPGEKAMA